MKIAAAIVFSGLASLLLRPCAAADATASQRGAIVFQHWCAPCHAAGPGHPATTSLGFKYKGEKTAVLEQRTDLDAGVIKYFVRNGIANMTSFRKTEISDSELNALASYLSPAALKQ